MNTKMICLWVCLLGAQVLALPPYHHQPAPLNHDGTVADTPDIKHAKAIHFAAVAHELKHADPHWQEPHHGHYEGHHEGPVKFGFSVHHDHHAPAHHEHYEPHAPIHHKHYEPAPLNHDGTVADTADIKHAKAIHFAAVAHELKNADPHWQEPHGHYEGHSGHHVYRREAYHFAPHYEPAPLNHDGTVAETPEVQHAKAIHLAAYAEELAHADPHWKEPEVYNDKHYYEAPVHHAPVHHAPVHHAPVHHAPVHVQYSVHHAPIHHEPIHHEPIHQAPLHHAPIHHKFEPAPLNHDGTVADTPEIQALKKAHLAAHQHALSQVKPHHSLVH